VHVQRLDANIASRRLRVVSP